MLKTVLFHIFVETRDKFVSGLFVE